MIADRLQWWHKNEPTQISIRVHPSLSSSSSSLSSHDLEKSEIKVEEKHTQTHTRTMLDPWCVSALYVCEYVCVEGNCLAVWMFLRLR